MENNLKDMEKRQQEERDQLRASCTHEEKDIAESMMHNLFCKRCGYIMPSDYISEAEKKKKQEKAHEQVVNVEFEVLPNGCLKFKRGDSLHNREMKKLICNIIDGDEYTMKELDKFFKGSEDIELLVGDTILCG